jgi:hypothetical protein
LDWTIACILYTIIMVGKGKQQKNWSHPVKSAPAAASSIPLPSADSITPVVTSPKVTMVTPEAKHSMCGATPSVSASSHLAPADGMAWDRLSPASLPLKDLPQRAHTSASLPVLEDTAKPPAIPLKSYLSSTDSTTTALFPALCLAPADGVAWNGLSQASFPLMDLPNRAHTSASLPLPEDAEKPPAPPVASHDVPVNTGGSWPHAATSSFDVPCVETVTDDASIDVTFQKIFAAVKCQHAAKHAKQVSLEPLDVDVVSVSDFVPTTSGLGLEQEHGNDSVI